MGQSIKLNNPQHHVFCWAARHPLRLVVPIPDRKLSKLAAYGLAKPHNAFPGRHYFKAAMSLVGVGLFVINERRPVPGGLLTEFQHSAEGVKLWDLWQRGPEGDVVQPEQY